MSFAEYRCMVPRTACIRPTRALGNPLWWSALVLAVGSTQVATSVTAWLGLATHAAVLLVVPALVAIVLGLRTRSALLACHVVIGQLYAGIQLSPALAALCASPLGLLGLSWSPGRGPHYLVCALGLVASYAWVSPGMTRAAAQRTLPTAPAGTLANT